MTLLTDITPVVLTWNEEANVKRVFDQLAWARDVVVVDSGSTDGTLALLSGYSNVRVYTKAFRSHEEQWNYAIRQTSISTAWILTLDADYVLGDDLVREIASTERAPGVVGYAARFVYVALSRPLRGSLYPPRVVLFERDKGHFIQEGHTQRLLVEGATSILRSPIYHDDRKSFSRWLVNQERYSLLEAQRLLAAPSRELDWADRVRRVGFLAPALVAAYCLVLKGCAVDGRAGWYYTLQRVVAEALIAMRLLELRTR
jgi:glycosyltransferase involved in cell wall biosynthesis